MNPVVEEWHLATAHVGKRVLVFDRLDSTNTFALARADDPANDGLVVIADEQTAGRGQYGRSWSCPDGAGVLTSALLFPPADLRRPVIMTALAVVSVCELIQQATSLHATVKWPNDVLINGRKVAGVLIEQRVGTVIGIGLNVNQPDSYFFEAGLPHAASLAEFIGKICSTRDLARMLIRVLDERYSRLQRGLADLESQWKALLGLVGRSVSVETASDQFQGLLRSLTFDALTVDLADGNCRNFPPESIRQMHAFEPSSHTS